MRRFLLALAPAAALLAPAAAAPVAAQEPAGEGTEELRVFLDCQTFLCDFDHFRREIGFVAWVRDRQDADVHVLMTSEDTGAGGERLTITYIGRGRFAGEEETLTVDTDPTATDEESRDRITRTLGLGLVRFAVRTPAGRRLRVEAAEEPTPGERAPTDEPEDDPWNLWVFTPSVRLSLEGEESAKSVSVSGGIDASRVSREWKIELELDGRYSERRFEVGDGEITSLRRSYGADVLVVNSLTDHLSAGVQASVNHSIFRNYDAAVRVAPAVEWNLYPYAESTRRQLRVLYEVGGVYNDYRSRTIFDRTDETLADQSLTVTLDLNQPWGNARASLEGSHFLHDFSKNRVTLFGNLDLRVFRGLSFSVFGRVSHVADQINLSAEGESEEDVLLRRRELATAFRYDLSVGFRYTFGSIYNNVVNPRFGGSGGRFFF